MDSHDKLLSQAQAAVLIGISRQAVSHAVNNRLLPYEQIDTYRLIRESAAYAYKKNRPLAGWKKGKSRGKR